MNLIFPHICIQLNNYTYAYAQPFRAPAKQSSVVQKIAKPIVSAVAHPTKSAGGGGGVEVPAFQAMPSSVARIATGVVQLDDSNDVVRRQSVAAAAYQLPQQQQQYSKTVKREVNFFVCVCEAF